MEKPATALKDGQENSKQSKKLTMEKPATPLKDGQENYKQKQQRVVWDCESSLYDSFELKSFKRQLDSAIISSRTNSMPRLSNRAPLISETKEKTSSSVSTTKKSKISGSLKKFLRSVFRPKHTDSSTIFHVEEKYKYSNKESHGFYDVDYDINYLQPFGELLTTIPEIDLEMGNSKDPQPEYYDDSSFVRKTVSERFTKRSMIIGISCV